MSRWATAQLATANQQLSLLKVGIDLLFVSPWLAVGKLDCTNQSGPTPRHTLDRQTETDEEYATIFGVNDIFI
ncbi:unnamed protein product [Protopolystoma xenopodis]|uniref:Uncharacterized protein n=1 Tax=Protopolystoma xenopodis TaxID=117903 RepID=A0A448XJ94_9PLAT|nr:unnamed protein product [Protopolystoma xenopodis]